MNLALLVAVALVGGFALEHLLLRRGAAGYFTLGFPLPSRLVPIRRPIRPGASGRSGPFRWSQPAPGRIHFWADPDDRGAPTLLHGLILLTAARGETHLDVRWAPPWTPLLGCGWLVALGAARGELGLTAPIAAALSAVVAILYLRAAQQAAARIRFDLQSDEAPPDVG